MSFAKITQVNEVHDFSWFGVGEFFRFDGSIWVKYSTYGAVNVSGDDLTEHEFSYDTQCENIEVELKVL